MLKGKAFLRKKWLILGLSCLLLPLYQNMSPFDEGKLVDLRDYAPRRPAGYLENPMAAYFPSDVSGDSLGDISSHLLGHNFDPMLKRTEGLGVSLLGGSHSFKSYEDSAPLILMERERPDLLRMDVSSPTSLRLSYQLFSEAGSQWTMVCEADGRKGLNFQMNHPLSSRVNVGLSHETQEKSSQLRMGIAW